MQYVESSLTDKSTVHYYEGCSKSSDLYLVALSRDFFEKHTMQHSKELVFTPMVMLQCNMLSLYFTV